MTAAARVLRAPAHLEASLTLLTQATVPRFFGWFKGRHRLALPALGGPLEPSAAGSIADDAFVQFDVARLRGREGKALFDAYIDQLRALRARTPDVRAASWWPLVQDYSLAIGLDLEDGKRVWVPVFAREAAMLERTLDAIEGLRMGETLVVFDGKDDDWATSPFVQIGEYCAFRRDGVVLRFCDLDADTDETMDVVLEARLDYGELIESLVPSGRALLGMLGRVSEALGMEKGVAQPSVAGSVGQGT
ncbi:MAG: hypothetical protein ACK5S2_05420 [Lysobacteraceae bacterium]|nr:hypothetical protein [Silanimonas sp.]